MENTSFTSLPLSVFETTWLRKIVVKIEKNCKRKKRFKTIE